MEHYTALAAGALKPAASGADEQLEYIMSAAALRGRQRTVLTWLQLATTVLVSTQVGGKIGSRGLRAFSVLVALLMARTCG